MPNADNTPDVALAGGVGHAVFDGGKLMDASIAVSAQAVPAEPGQGEGSRSPARSRAPLRAPNGEETV